MLRLSDPSQALVFDRIVSSLTPRNSDRINITIRDDADEVSDDHNDGVHVHLHHPFFLSWCVVLLMRDLMMHAGGELSRILFVYHCLQV